MWLHGLWQAKPCAYCFCDLAAMCISQPGPVQFCSEFADAFVVGAGRSAPAARAAKFAVASM